MVGWKSYLIKDSTDWLLKEDNPSVKYFTLVDLLDRNEADTEVIDAKKGIMTKGIIPKILQKQKKGGYWETPENFYVRTKYKGTVWQIIILAELGAESNNEKIQESCEFILANAQDKASGAFAYVGGKRGGEHDKILPCLTGNLLWSLIRFDYLDDPRMQQAIDWILKYQRFDDGGTHPPDQWPYNVGSKKGEACWGNHTCHMGVVKNLKALAEIPMDKRSNEIKKTIDDAVEYLLKHYIYKRSHDPRMIAKQEWTEFGFPLMWKIDALEVMDILTRLGVKDERMREAIELVRSKQNEEGRWILEKSFNGRMQVNIEQKGKESKWITLKALRVLKRFYC
jgi:hypothetical protein